MGISRKLMVMLLVMTSLFFASCQKDQPVVIPVTTTAVVTVPVEPVVYFPYFEQKENQVLWGLKGTDGSVLIKPSYTYFEQLDIRGYFQANKDEIGYLIDASGRVLLEAPADTFYDKWQAHKLTLDKELLAYYDEATKRYGYKRGEEVVLTPAYDFADNFKDGYAVVQRNGYDGGSAIIDLKGNVIWEDAAATFVNLGSEIIGRIDNVYGISPDYALKTVHKVTGEQLFKEAYFDIIPLMATAKTAVGTEGTTEATQTTTEATQATTEAVTEATSEAIQPAFFVNDGKLGRFLDSQGKPVAELEPVSGFGQFTAFSTLIQAEGSFGNVEKLGYMDHSGKWLWQYSATLNENQGAIGMTVTHNEPIISKFYKAMQLSVAIDGDEKATTDINLKLKVQEDPAFDLEALTVSEETADVKRIGDVIVVEKNQYYYPIGAAHGSYGTTYDHYDLKSHKWLLLSDLFSDQVGGFNLISSVILQEMTDGDNEIGSIENFWLEDGLVIDNKRTYHLTPSGVEIVFQQYEIGPYAIGMPTFEIPYLLLQPYLNIDQPVIKSLLAEAKISSGGVVDEARMMAMLLQLSSHYELKDSPPVAVPSITPGSALELSWQSQFEGWRSSGVKRMLDVKATVTNKQEIDVNTILYQCTLNYQLEMKSGKRVPESVSLYYLLDLSKGVENFYRVINTSLEEE